MSYGVIAGQNGVKSTSSLLASVALTNFGTFNQSFVLSADYPNLTSTEQNKCFWTVFASSTGEDMDSGHLWYGMSRLLNYDSFCVDMFNINSASTMYINVNVDYSNNQFSYIITKGSGVYGSIDNLLIQLYMAN